MPLAWLSAARLEIPRLDGEHIAVQLPRGNSTVRGEEDLGESRRRAESQNDNKTLAIGAPIEASSNQHVFAWDELISRLCPAIRAPYSSERVSDEKADAPLAAQFLGSPDDEGAFSITEIDSATDRSNDEPLAFVGMRPSQDSAQAKGLFGDGGRFRAPSGCDERRQEDKEKHHRRTTGSSPPGPRLVHAVSMAVGLRRHSLSCQSVGKASDRYRGATPTRRYGSGRAWMAVMSSDSPESGSLNRPGLLSRTLSTNSSTMSW